MKKVIFLIFILLLLVGCEEYITIDYLQEGNWVATAGYEGGEVDGNPECPIIRGLNFIDENMVYIEHIAEEFEYTISEERDGQISFYSDSLSKRMWFDTTIIDENGIVIEGQGQMEDQVCYLERQTKEE
ncbi:hypothetical protein [Oceanobacillus sp. 1P07AA]|uniref:hypothetical protein n=1 Tax=Oceanobacillus sp. 1P07AA TaxID=3132293 RepID=UPI0039A4E331